MIIASIDLMNGKAVLPMVIIIEWMAHGAMHGNPGMKFVGFDNLRILKGLTLNEDEACTVQILAGKAIKNGSTRMVPVELSSSGGNGSSYVHARAEILLAARFPGRDTAATEVPLQPYPLKTYEIYDKGRLFHGPDFRGIERVEGCSEQGIAAFAKAAPAPSAWIKNPLRNTWLADPLVIDSSFQMMVLWCLEKNGVGLRRFLVKVEGDEEINEEAVIDELRILIAKWSLSWLRYSGTTVSITTTGEEAVLPT